jgi:helicase
MVSALNIAYRDSPPSLDNFVELVGSWIEGRSYSDLAERSELEMDRLLPALNGPVVYTLHELVDQALSALVEIAAESDLQLPQSVRLFSQHLKFGVPTEAARQLASHGVRHRQASVELGAAIHVRLSEDDELSASDLALEELGDARFWVERLGRLVFVRTSEDLANGRT